MKLDVHDGATADGVGPGVGAPERHSCREQHLRGSRGVRAGAAAYEVRAVVVAGAVGDDRGGLDC